MVRLAGDLLAAGQNRLDVREGDGGRAAFVALDDAGDQLSPQLFVLGEQRVAFRLADLLDHHLLGGLGADPLGHLGGFHGHAVVGTTDRAVGPVDLNNDFLLFAVVLLGGRDQGRLDAGKDDFFVDVLIAVDRVDDPKQFVGIHSLSLSLASTDILHAPLDPPKRPRRFKILRYHNLVGS